MTVYPATPSFPAPRTADIILPLSTMSKTHSQMLSFPDGDTSTNLTFPMVWLNGLAAFKRLADNDSRRTPLLPLLRFSRPVTLLKSFGTVTRPTSSSPVCPRTPISLRRARFVKCSC